MTGWKSWTFLNAWDRCGQSAREATEAIKALRGAMRAAGLRDRTEQER